MDENIKAEEIDKMYAKLMNDANIQLNNLQMELTKQKSKEEQTRLKKIQEDMEIERKRTESEEKRKMEEEEIRKR